MKSLRILLSLAAALALAGCAAGIAFDEGRNLIESGDMDGGLAKVSEAVAQNPGSREYRAYYDLQRKIALRQHLALAEQARRAGRSEAAESLYRRMLLLDPENTQAKAGLEALAAERRQRELLADAGQLYAKGDLAAAHAKTAQVLVENPSNRDAQQLLRRIEERTIKATASRTRLAAALRKPVSIEFRDASLRQVFDVLSRQTGLNFIFDREVKPDLRTTISVKNTNLDEVLRFILVTNQLERKVLNGTTLLVYPNTQAKNRDYQDLVVKSFYLANADVKQTANMIKSMVKTKDMYVDEKLNLLVIRDTPDAVRMAERLIANQDLAEPETMLEVEVLEVASSLLTELGIRYPEQLSYSLVGAAGTPGTVTLPEWLNRDAGLVRLTVTDPLLIVNLKDQVGHTNVLANPRIRVKNREKAKIHIGDKVPVITTTTTSTGFASESVSYLDVGLKLDVEPTVYLDNDVGIRVGLEVSNIVREITSSTGTLTYQVGTRTANTTLRLHDGETQILAGLISDEDRNTVYQIPGLGNIPLLGRLFGSNSDTANKTEIVLLITPHVVRNLARPALRFEEFAGGTESAVGAPPLLLSGAPGNALPLAETGAVNPSGRVLLSAVPTAPGQELTVQLSMDLDKPMRSGLFDIAYDPAKLRFVRAEPGALVAASPTEVGFRVNAPGGAGRLNLNISSKGEIKGTGELARLTFQPLASSSGTSAVRLEAATVTDTKGSVVSAQLPPPVSLNLAR